jgi:uncharacterized protein (DUF2126 family)
VLDLGHQVDAELLKHDVRLTMGGEPTFVSIDDMDGPEWNFTALSDKKRELAGDLLTRLQGHFAPGAMLHFGQGKWYPGEPLPRWALGCYWRTDGKPLWRDASLLVTVDGAGTRKTADALHFIRRLARELGLDPGYVIAAYEDVTRIIDAEQRWPENFDPLKADLKKPDERLRVAKLLERGLGEAAGYVLPLKALPPETKKRRPASADSSGNASRFRSSPWPLRREHLYLIPGDSPLGLRLPLASLPWVAPGDKEEEHARDPFAAQEPLADPVALDAEAAADADAPRLKIEPPPAAPKGGHDPREIVHTALCAEVRDGVLCIFLPPVPLLEDFVTLLSAIEASAADLKLPLRLEGYTPPADPRLKEFRITPDPGVIEVNIHPASSWRASWSKTPRSFTRKRA